MKLGNFKYFLSELLIIIFLLILTAWYFWPLLTHFTTNIIEDYDGLFITWSINRMAQNFPLASPKLNAKAGFASPNPDVMSGEGGSYFERLFTGNIFYPHPFSQAYSDPFITAGIIAKPILSIFKEPVTAFNINLLLGQFLTLYFTYLFLKELSKDKLLALVLSVVFSFSFIHLHYLPHLHTFCIYLLPLSGYCLVKFIKNKKVLWLYAWAITFILQMLNSFLPGYFILFLALTILLKQKNWQVILLKNARHVLMAAVIIIVVLFPFLNIYLKVSHYFNYVRPLTEVIHFSLSPEEIITKFFSPILYLITLISFIFLISHKKLRTRSSLLFLISFLLSFILSLGPALHWLGKTVKIPLSRSAGLHIPLPYLLFYYAIPGFQGLRTPSRWILLMAFYMVIFSSAIMVVIYKKLPRLRLVSLILLLCLSLIFIKKPLNYITLPMIKDYPPVYNWLKNQHASAVIELPIYTWSGGPQTKQEVYRMLYSLDHKKNLVNGYSGYFPEDYNQLVGLLTSDFPNPNTVSILKSMGVNYLILHKKEYNEISQEQLNHIIKQLNQTKDITFIRSFGDDLVYHL
jgi:hypothetical protein